MALNTKTLSSLIQSLAEAINDYLSFSTTTNIAANNYVISTTLTQHDESEDDHFGGADTEWWLYISGTANVGVHRRTTDYLASSGRVTVAGAALAAESGAATCQIFRYNRDHYKNAIIGACREVYPSLHLDLEDTTLITGNILPDGSFEDWASSTSLNWYTVNAGALARQSAAGSTRNSSYAAKYTAGAASDYFYLSSKSYPRLLDLQDQDVDIYGWVYPQVANNATLTVYTIDSAGSTQTLASTTACGATTWTKIFRENMTLNDDLVEIQVRMGVTTDTKYAIFDDIFLKGRRMFEYLLPPNFRDGHLDSVHIQSNGHSDEICYDLHPFSTIHPGSEEAFDIISSGTHKYVAVGRALPTERRIRLLGKKPLETLSADTDTITIDDYRIPLLIAKARMLFFEREATPISSQDKQRFEIEYSKAERDYRRLLRLRMV